MRFTPDPLSDKEFLAQLDSYPQKILYAKVIALNWNESPIREIQGKIISGSINIDGASAVRRTCSLNLTTDPLATGMDMESLDWALKTKIRVEIGLQNFINKEYPDIIWFPQGTFVMTSYSQSINAQGFNIQLQAKDKMCLLNGDVGGNLYAAHKFDTIKTLMDDGSEIEEKIDIYHIIREAVHTYAQEPYDNIIINDLESCAVELISYTAKNEPMYVYAVADKNGVLQENICFGNSNNLGKFLEAFVNSDEYNQHLVMTGTYGQVNLLAKDDIYDGVRNPLAANFYLIKACDYGETAGYQLTSLTYAGDLTAAVGEAVTSVLDKIKNQLGEFEYFYNLAGQFVFQRKRIYYNSKWTNAVTTEQGTYYDSLANSSALSYRFNSGQLVESFANKPNLTAIKNDFSIWGHLTSTTSNQIPVHLRVAIDERPEIYESPRGKIYRANHVAHSTPAGGNVYDVDWRELIFQMAYDYQRRTDKMEQYAAALDGLAYPTDDDQYAFLYFEPVEKQPIETSDTRNIYIYKEHEWLRLKPVEFDKYRNSEYDFFVSTDTIPEKVKKILVLWEKTFHTGYDAYYTDMLEFWRQLYIGPENYDITIQDEETGEYYRSKYMEDSEFARWAGNGYWNPDILEYSPIGREVFFIHPELMLFWIDFLDTDSNLLPYRVSAIGRRTKAVNDSDVKAIMFGDVPPLLFVNGTIDDQVVDTGYVGYARVNIPSNIWNYLSISTQGKSAKEALDALIYQCTYYNETITLSTIPIYYLEPNTRIQVYNKETNINHEYLINSLSIQLQHDGMMSIQASKAEQNIL